MRFAFVEWTCILSWCPRERATRGILSSGKKDHLTTALVFQFPASISLGLQAFFNAVFLNTAMRHLCERVFLGARGEHGKRGCQAERGKHQIFGNLQILEQLRAKFVDTLNH